PLGWQVVGALLECALLPVVRADRDPAAPAPHDLPAGERGVERAQPRDVRRVQRDELQSSCDGHAPIVPPTTDNGTASRDAGRYQTSPSRQSAVISPSRSSGTVLGST